MTRTGPGTSASIKWLRLTSGVMVETRTDELDPPSLEVFRIRWHEGGGRLPLAAYHLDDNAQLWHQLFMQGETTGVKWEASKEGLHARYGPTMFEDFFGDLSKLK